VEMKEISGRELAKGTSQKVPGGFLVRLPEDWLELLGSFWFEVSHEPNWLDDWLSLAKAELFAPDETLAK